MREMRRSLAPESRLRVSASVCAALAADPCLAAARPTGPVVAVYLATPDEIDLADFIREMLRRGATVVAPRWNGKSYDLARLYGLSERELRRGPMNVAEPAEADIVEPQSVNAWIVPGLAFASDGRRLGYGGGWYDRLLASAAVDAVRIGVAHEFQVLDDLPAAPHDIAMDRVVTELGQFGSAS